MKQIGDVDVMGLPPTFFVEGGEILAPIRTYKKANLFVAISDIPFDQYIAEEFAIEVKKFSEFHKIKKIVIVSGMETVNQKKDTPKIYGLRTHPELDKILYDNEIPKFLDGSIFGTDAAIISVFRKTKIPVLFLYAECHPFFPNPEASIAAILTLGKVLGVKVDTNDIQNKMDKLRIQHRNLMEETAKALQQQQKQQQTPKEKQVRIPQIYR